MRHLCILYNVSANPEAILVKASDAFKEICSDELVLVKDLNEILHGSQGLNFDNIVLITKGILDTEEEYFKSSFTELINNAVPNATVSFWEVVSDGKAPTLENLYSKMLSFYPSLQYHKLVKLTVQLVPKCILGNSDKSAHINANIITNAVSMSSTPIAMTPEPIAMTPEPESTPIPMTPEPIAMTPEPEPMPMPMTPEPEPMPMTSESDLSLDDMLNSLLDDEPDPAPILMTSEPVPMTSETAPIPMTSEPVPMEPEPAPVPMTPDPAPIPMTSEPAPEPMPMSPELEPAPSSNLREDVSPDLDIMSLLNNNTSIAYDDYDEDDLEPTPISEPVPMTPASEPVPMTPVSEPEPVPMAPEPTPVSVTPEPTPIPTPEPVPTPTPEQARRKGVFGRFKRKTRENHIEASTANVTGVPQPQVPIHQEEQFLVPEYTQPSVTQNTVNYNRAVSIPFLKEPKVIFVTSAKSMGASTVAANLALTVSSALNFSTLLIDADLKNRMQSNIFSTASASDIRKQNSLVSLLNEQGHSRVERYALRPWANLDVLYGSYNGDSAILNNKPDLTEIPTIDLQSIVFPALTHYRAIIVDIPWDYILKYPQCVQMANKILYVTSGDYSGIIDIDTNVNSKFFANEYTDYIPVVQRISFVLNKWSPNTLGVLNGKQFRMTPEVFIKVLQNFIDMENDPIMLTRAVGSIPYFDQMPNTLLNSIPVTMIADNDPTDGKCIGNKYLQYFLQILLNL